MNVIFINLKNSKTLDSLNIGDNINAKKVINLLHCQILGSIIHIVMKTIKTKNLHDQHEIENLNLLSLSQ